MPIAVAPFTDDHLTRAAALLAQRQRAQRIAEPLLPARFEDVVNARIAVEALWRRPGASGVVAAQGEQLLGYLLGTPASDTRWGRSTWVPFAGHALAPGQSAELYRDLYAALSAQWAAAGALDHYALVPASDTAALAAWFALGFGQEQAHALRPLGLVGVVPAPPGVAIRRAVPGDLDAIMRVADLIGRHQAGAPTFAPFLQETAALREAWRGPLADPAVSVWLVLRDGDLLAFQVFAPHDPAGDNPLVPEGGVELKVAATRPDARGSGIGRALTSHGLRAARDAGHTTCAADWRVTNLLASRFWPRQGFRPVAYRLARRLDPRIAPASG